MEARAEAMSLNNVAVALLARGCLRQGCFLLNEARDLVKYGCLNDEKSLSSIQVFTRIQASRQQCRSALASPCQEGSPNVSDAVNILHSTGQPIRMPTSLIRPRTDEFSFVHMEAPLHASGSDPQELETLTAFILFNLGMAQLYVDHVQRHQRSSLRSQNKALSLFKASHLVLARSKSPELSCGIPNLVACVNAICVQRIIVLFGQLGFPQDSIRYAQELLGDMLQHFSQMGQMLRLQDNAAAAA
eukprot:CAMPEP_0168784756 /NCGR_PEP_ID=MMETSP0725-20121227/10388_1 /TAXON_ID=265536 /ORGANISM="Amphiprora sp., Strain CCMP467" /LENGTH=244 /DNA_ID=CAMNT_0008834819 /DNA_START=60 /DNA_END=794 /DNA_ORIENTATION=+